MDEVVRSAKDLLNATKTTTMPGAGATRKAFECTQDASGDIPGKNGKFEYNVKRRTTNFE